MPDENFSKLKKAELVERFSRRLGRLPKDQLAAFVHDVESGVLDLAGLAEGSLDRRSGYKRPWGFQTRFHNEREGGQAPAE
jgi:hypothetical protein